MSENLNRISITLNEPQTRVLYELLNLTGLALAEIDADYGSDSLESIVAREPLLDEVNVGRVCHRLFDLLAQNLEQFDKERDV